MGSTLGLRGAGEPVHKLSSPATESPPLPMSTPRRRSREAALQAEYAMSIAGGDIQEAVLRMGTVEGGEVRPQDEFSSRLLMALEQHREEVDEEIAAALKRWTADRLGGPERALLRLGATEILFFDDVPAAAAINEYIELAKVYCDAEAPKFLNGVLDAIRKKRGGATPRPKPAKGARAPGA